MMAFETRYEVSTQVLSSCPAERLPAIWGSATFATLVSSTSMNVASVTVSAMTHGLINGRLVGAAEMELPELTSRRLWVQRTSRAEANGRCFLQVRARFSLGLAAPPSRNFRSHFPEAEGSAARRSTRQYCPHVLCTCVRLSPP